MTWLRLVLAAGVILAGSLPGYAATAANRDLERIPFNLGFLFVVAIVLVVMGDKAMLMGSDRRLSSDIRNPSRGDTENPATSATVMPRRMPVRVSP